jgi:hypothetical protein
MTPDQRDPCHGSESLLMDGPHQLPVDDPDGGTRDEAEYTSTPIDCEAEPS